MINLKKQSQYLTLTLATAALVLGGCSHVETQETSTESASVPVIEESNTTQNTVENTPPAIDYPIHSLVRFNFDSHDLTSDAKLVLNEVSEQITSDNTTIINISLDGHADAKGTMKYNDQLSLDRAKATRDYLSSQLSDININWDLEAYGETQPTASNSTTEGRLLNRRVELHITVDEPVAQSLSQ